MNPIGPKLAEGRDSEIFDHGPGRVLRVARDGRFLNREAEVMCYVRDRGYPVPAVFDAGQGYLVMGRLEGFLGLFADDAVFIVPGSTRLSGDHDKEAFRTVLDDLAEATKAGRHRLRLVCSYDGQSGTMCVFDNFVTVGGTEQQYHSVHEWMLRDGVPHAWMLYVPEYAVFEQAWR